ncbi:hypothetical protein DY000_02024997 [Brassica cretica]|uniref:Uncharacterized protein n=1 Tax=Brassica cretica TaxID=69181 RepID=A0ABQ7EC08_BRACR|nr:hypothetical protein DY000_02024997 [Brassica cretica]
MPKPGRYSFKCPQLKLVVSISSLHSSTNPKTETLCCIPNFETKNPKTLTGTTRVCLRREFFSDESFSPTRACLRQEPLSDKSLSTSSTSHGTTRTKI